ncbi:MAG: HNH endonuclease [Proteobacteria bacterium]|nr:HNH endonuclease [Pseudomonadota bacterium]
MGIKEGSNQQSNFAIRWTRSGPIHFSTLPRYSGFRKVVERDDHRCQNPRCNARNLRVQAHHIEWVSLGGSNDLKNGIALCSSCHLRLVHTKKASVVRQGSRVTVFE